MTPVTSSGESASVGAAFMAALVALCLAVSAITAIVIAGNEKGSSLAAMTPLRTAGALICQPPNPFNQ